MGGVKEGGAGARGWTGGLVYRWRGVLEGADREIGTGVSPAWAEGVP